MTDVVEPILWILHARGSPTWQATSSDLYWNLAIGSQYVLEDSVDSGFGNVEPRETISTIELFKEVRANDAIGDKGNNRWALEVGPLQSVGQDSDIAETRGSKSLLEAVRA